MSLKAIETRYAGYRFRSRTEARWAVFFDSLDIKWDYEPEGFELSDGTWYLPDFRLTDTFGCRYWLEVKGDAPKAAEVRKAQLLCIGLDDEVFLATGGPGDNEALWFRPKQGNAVPETVATRFPKAAAKGKGWAKAGYNGALSAFLIVAKATDAKIPMRRLRECLEQARGRRFEHGERDQA